MKTLTKLALAIAAISIGLTSCKKTKQVKPATALESNFPSVLNSIITPAILDTLQSHGAVINGGLTPPTVNGIYLLSPDYCTYDNSGGGAAGTELGDYKFQFTNQNTGEFTIVLNYKEITDGVDAGSDNSATYISGSGNLFTIFAKATGVEEGINYTSLFVISGQVSIGGITNFQLTYYLISKTGDASNSVLVPVHTTRIVKDEDGFSETQTTFSLNPAKIQSIGKNKLKSIFSAVKDARIQ